MTRLLDKLRTDAGRKTLGELIQEREAAAAEIERLAYQLSALQLKGSNAPRNRTSETVANEAQAYPALLRMNDLSRRIGLSRSSIYLAMAKGEFPKPLRISDRAVRWRSEDIARWVEQRSMTAKHGTT